MKFTKMEGLGNDYIYVNCFEETVENPAETSIRLSDRHFGIGADGLILIKPSDTADCKMDMYNADGSRSEMCGNGIRCVGKYVYENGITDKTEISVETLAGIKYLSLNVEDGQVKTVKVNMGAPILEPGSIPVTVPEGYGNQAVMVPIKVVGTEYKTTCVSMGNPHSVVFVDDVDNFPLETIGPLFENHKMFPNRINAEFIQIIDRKHVKMRVWERGTGETLACGTGACASTVACILNDKTDDEITVSLRGGELKIKWDRAENTVYMTGPATTVFKGEV